MNIGNLVKVAFSSLFRNKMRTALTMLGIIIGIASVIAMVSIGQASTQSVKSELSTMGSNMIMIMPARQQRGGVDMGMSASKSLDNKDLESLTQNTRYVAAVSPMVSSSKQLIYGNNNHSCSINEDDFISIICSRAQLTIIYKFKIINTHDIVRVTLTWCRTS